MGCLKLTYQENEPLLKCVWNKNEPEKPVQWFYGVDPMAEKYYFFSPYVYCANNPIRFIDPDGRDVWEIDEEGRIRKRTKDETQDAFFMVDADGNVTFTTDDEGNKTYNIISFEYKTVESQRSISFSPDGTTTDSYDVYQVRGDDKGTALFNFMSEHITGSPTKVEISQAKTGVAGDKGINFITTSHQKNRESGMSYLLAGQLYYGYTIRELNHSHPQGMNPSSGDRGFAKDVTNTLSGQGLRIPNFNIWHVPSKTLIPFR